MLKCSARTVLKQKRRKIWIQDSKNTEEVDIIGKEYGPFTSEPTQRASVFRSPRFLALFAAVPNRCEYSAASDLGLFACALCFTH